MDTSTSQVRNPSRPAMITFSVAYCLILTIKIAYWLVSDGWGMARTGDISIIMLLPAALTCILLAVGSLLLWLRSAKSSWFLLGSLLFGLMLIPLMLPEVFLVSASHYVQVAWFVLPAALQAALLIAVWVYSLRIRRTGYFK